MENGLSDEAEGRIAFELGQEGTSPHSQLSAFLDRSCNLSGTPLSPALNGFSLRLGHGHAEFPCKLRTQMEDHLRRQVPVGIPT
eukprot:scaffold8300_cov783-Pinguiococcus_pyrenoidosus.AAC.1